MKLFKLPILDKAARRHGDLDGPLGTWRMMVEGATWTSLDAVRKSWKNCDEVEGDTVFNIKGNKYRLICRINYGSQSVFVKELLTHAEYDKGNWKK